MSKHSPSFLREKKERVSEKKAYLDLALKMGEHLKGELSHTNCKAGSYGMIAFAFFEAKKYEECLKLSERSIGMLSASLSQFTDADVSIDLIVSILSTNTIRLAF